MHKPYLLVVTGRPGAGKTTLAKVLADEFHMPLISRDQIKEGYVHTCRKSHDDLSKETNGIVTEVFFETIHLLLKSKVSLIVEAAFQHKLWSEKLVQFMDQADIHILICKVDDALAHKRYLERGIANPLREHFHGDGGVLKGTSLNTRNCSLVQGVSTKNCLDYKNHEVVSILPYVEPKLDVPTYHIDTKDRYEPSIAELKKLIIG